MDTCTQPITSTGVLPSNQVPVLSLLLCDISSLFSHSFNAVSIETEGRRRLELTSSAQSLYGTGRWAAGYLETQADSSDHTHTHTPVQSNSLQVNVCSYSGLLLLTNKASPRCERQVCSVKLQDFTGISIISSNANIQSMDTARLGSISWLTYFSICVTVFTGVVIHPLTQAQVSG